MTEHTTPTNAAAWVNALDLSPHPEGGYYKETYRADLRLPSDCLGDDFAGDRNVSTAIYYLLEQGDFSAFHRIASDEVWHHYGGGGLEVHMISPQGEYRIQALGKCIDAEEEPQCVVPAGWWFASRPASQSDYALVGCTVAPGFDFADFEMAKRAELLDKYPQHSEIITALTRD